MQAGQSRPIMQTGLHQKGDMGKNIEIHAEQLRGNRDKRTRKLTAAIKRHVKADNKEHLAEQVRENKEDSNKTHLWKAVKNLEGKFSPKLIQMRNKSGMLAPLKRCRDHSR